MKLKPITVNAGSWFQAHEFSEDYPLVEGPPLWAMADHMKKTIGFVQENPIVLFRDHERALRVLDGRRRQMACKRTGIVPAFVEFIGTDLEALAYVEAMNMHRRHLGEADRDSISKKSVGRRALLAGMAASAESGKSPKCRNSDTTAIPPKTLAEAAKEQGISRDTAAEGKLVVIKGTEQQKQAVIEGERSVSDVANEIRESDKARTNRTAKQLNSKTSAAKPPKNGTAINWRELDKLAGGIVNFLSLVGGEDKESPKRYELQGRVEELVKDIRAWEKELRSRRRASA